MTIFVPKQIICLRYNISGHIIDKGLTVYSLFLGLQKYCFLCKCANSPPQSNKIAFSTWKLHPKIGTTRNGNNPKIRNYTNYKFRQNQELHEL